MVDLIDAHNLSTNVVYKDITHAFRFNAHFSPYQVINNRLNDLSNSGELDSVNLARKPAWTVFISDLNQRLVL